MLAEDRRTRLLERIRVRGFATLPDLAGELEVSESTVRRDLDYLEETGSAKRTHGGVFYTGPSPKVPHFDQRQAMQLDKKQQIAQAACKLIEDTDTVLLDGGSSTTYELARLLIGRPLQVVTNSLPVANLFTASDSADLVIVGGYVHARTGVSIGPYANHDPGAEAEAVTLLWAGPWGAGTNGCPSSRRTAGGTPRPSRTAGWSRRA